MSTRRSDDDHDDDCARLQLEVDDEAVPVLHFVRDAETPIRSASEPDSAVDKKRRGRKHKKRKKARLQTTENGLQLSGLDRGSTSAVHFADGGETNEARGKGAENCSPNGPDDLEEANDNADTAREHGADGAEVAVAMQHYPSVYTPNMFREARLSYIPPEKELTERKSEKISVELFAETRRWNQEDPDGQSEEFVGNSFSISAEESVQSAPVAAVLETSIIDENSRSLQQENGEKSEKKELCDRRNSSAECAYHANTVQGNASVDMFGTNDSDRIHAEPVCESPLVKKGHGANIQDGNSDFDTGVFGLVRKNASRTRVAPADVQAHGVLRLFVSRTILLCAQVRVPRGATKIGGLVNGEMSEDALFCVKFSKSPHNSRIFRNPNVRKERQSNVLNFRTSIGPCLQENVRLHDGIKHKKSFSCSQQKK